MRINRHPAPIVADGDGMIGGQLHLDPIGMARHGLIHGVVEDFGHQMMQRALISAANIHTRPFADGLQPLQHLNR